MKFSRQSYQKKEDFWTPLDNAAKIFPAIRSKENTAVMRLTVVLNERITIRHLITAISLTEKRFPYFKVRLQKGFFWYYLEHTDHAIKPQIDLGTPCRAFSNRDSNKLLYRILVLKNRITVEFSHILTDGAGASNYLNTLLIFYFKEKGIYEHNEIDYFAFSDIDREEYEDAYNRFFKEDIPTIIRQPRAFHLPFALKPKPRFEVLIAMLSVADLKKKAAEKGVSITDYLISVYLFILQEIFNSIKQHKGRANHKILRIQVPINLRSLYPSKTMRNFSLFVMPEIDLRLGQYSFDEILKIVYHKMQLETDVKLVNKIISRNVGSERNLIVRGIPLFLKSMILYYKYYSEGANQYSGVITNLGRMILPPLISKKIEYFVVTAPPPNKILKVNCSVVGFQDKLVLCFGNITDSKEIERRYLRFLTGEGIRVRIINH